MVSASEVLEEDKAGETLWQVIMICLQIESNALLLDCLSMELLKNPPILLQASKKYKIPRNLRSSTFQRKSQLLWLPRKTSWSGNFELPCIKSFQ